MLGPDRAAKLVIEARLDRWIDTSLAGFVAPPGAPRVFSYPLDESVIAFERDEYLDEPVLHPELWATHRLLVRLFAGPLAASPEEADACFLPLFLPVYEAAEMDLRPTIEALELLPSGRPHLVASLWDGYPRPPSRRANPFSMQSLGRQQDPVFLDTAWSWLDRFRLLTLEASIDVDPADVSLFPLVQPVAPVEGPRPLLYAFCGATCYDHVPSEHVRGRDNVQAWERLRRVSDAFVGSPADARARFGEDAFRAVPAQSCFTLCPAGWSRWSFRLWEAITAGSIPVILSDYFVRPFAGQLDWDAFSLHLPEEALSDVDGILRALRPERVAALAAGVARVRRHMTPAGLATLVATTLAEGL